MNELTFREAAEKAALRMRENYVSYGEASRYIDSDFMLGKATAYLCCDIELEQLLAKYDAVLTEIETELESETADVR